MLLCGAATVLHMSCAAHVLRHPLVRTLLQCLQNWEFNEQVRV